MSRSSQGLGSLVIITIRYVLDCSGFEPPLIQEIFFYPNPFRLAVVFSQTSVHSEPKKRGLGLEHPPDLVLKIKNSYTSNFPFYLHGCYETGFLLTIAYKHLYFPGLFFGVLCVIMIY
jgi:hypothetical protein